MRSLGIALSLLLSASAWGAAQAVPGQRQVELVDRVVAVVGDTALLLSDVDGALAQLQAQTGRPIPPEQVPAARLEILRERVNELILVEAARAAGVTVDEAALTEQIDQRIAGLLTQFGGEAGLQQALAQEGLNRERYRALLISQARTESLREQYIRQQAGSRSLPLVSEEQIREAFEARRASLGQAPVRLSMQQVVIKAEPSDSARAGALREAQQVLEELQAGADFEVLARRFSDDPGSKEAGGDLGWFRPGRMVPEFESAAFAMRPGQTSGIVRSDFGYHIIRLERVRGAERKARHILISPEVTPADVERARQRADSVAAAVRGGASPTVLARAYDTPTSDSEVSRVPLEQLPPGYQSAAGTAATGDVLGPIQLDGPATTFAVVKVTGRQEAGPYTLDDVRDRVVQLLQEQRLTEQLVQELRHRVFVEILL